MLIQKFFLKTKVRKKRQPKPTHHLLIPLPEDIVEEKNYEGEGNEQKKIIDFVEDYLKNIIELTSFEKNDKIFFLKDLFSELHWVLFESLDKEQNNWEFNNRNEEVADRKKYNRIKIVLGVINSFKKKKKITNKQLILLESGIDKNNKKEVELLIQQLMQEIERPGEKYQENYSFRDYLRDNGKLKESNTKSYIKQNKLLKMNVGLFNTLAKEYYHKAGIKVDIENKKNTRIRKQRNNRFRQQHFCYSNVELFFRNNKKRIQV